MVNFSQFESQLRAPIINKGDALMNAVHANLVSGVVEELPRKLAGGAGKEAAESKGSLDSGQGEVKGRRRNGLR